jgi:hypothetical protein
MKKILFVLNLLAFYNLFSQSQSELLEKFTNANLSVVKVTYSWSNGWKIKSEKIAKAWPLSIERDANRNITKLILLRSGIVEEVFTPDILNYSIYFSNGVDRMCYLDGVFYYYTSKESENIKYLLSEDASNLEAESSALTDPTLLASYQKEAKKLQSGTKEKLIASIEKDKEAEALKNSIKNKKIKRLEVIWLTNENATGLDSKIEYGIKAFDEHGHEYSTNTLGGKMPWDDFDIKCKGAEPGDEFLMVPTTCREIIGNKVTLTIKSKYNPALTVSSSIKMSYATPVTVKYTGKDCAISSSGRSASGRGGVNLTLYVTESDDKTVHLVEIKDGTGASLHKIKVQKGVNIIVHNYGGNGCSASSGKSPGNGGDGGNITIVKSSGVSSTFIQHNNSGGKVGGGCCNGKNGMNGSFKETIQTVNLNF